MFLHIVGIKLEKQSLTDSVNWYMVNPRATAKKITKKNSEKSLMKLKYYITKEFNAKEKSKGGQMNG